MDKQQIIDLVITMKSDAVKLQIFDAASALRSIENTFKGQFVFPEEQKEVTVENFISLLNHYIQRTQDEETKSYLKSILRDFKINLVSR